MLYSIHTMSEAKEFKPYDVDYLLERLYFKLGSVSKSKIVLARPDVTVVNKKSNFINFRLVCKQLSREELDVQKYFEKESSMSVSISGEGVLVIHGIFRGPKIEQLLRNYITEFVQCSMCKSLETNLIKKNKLTILNCTKCHADRALNF